MNARIGVTLGSCAVGLVLAASTVRAATVTRCANPTGAAPCSKLQAAIAASGPGDTVNVYAGVYSGAGLAPDGYIHVDAGRDGMKVVGSGVVIIDNEIGTTTNQPQIVIDSSRVSVSRLTLRNGRSSGMLVKANNTDAVLSYLKVLGPQGVCLAFAGGNDRSKIALSTLRGCSVGIDYAAGIPSKNMAITSNTISFTGNAIQGQGTAALITGNKISALGGAGITVAGATGTKVSANQINSVDADGLHIDGDGVMITSNRINNVNNAATALYASGDGSVIQSNSINDATQGVIDARGSDVVIKANVVTASIGSIALSPGGTSGSADRGLIALNRMTAVQGGIGIDSGSRATIASNILVNAGFVSVYNGDLSTVMSNTLTWTGGIGVSCSDPNTGVCSGGIIQGNRLTDGRFSGIYVDTAFGGTPATGEVTITSNTVSRVGGTCFSVHGNQVRATGNKGYDCGLGNNIYTGGVPSPGFDVQGFNHTLSLNQIFRAAGDAYSVRTGDTTTTTMLTGNLADHAGEDAFDIHASHVTLSGNKALYATGVGFETETGYTAIALTGGNSGMGNALGACFSGANAGISGTNTLGTQDTPAGCTAAAGYIGD